jgi:hypothetical protein
MSTRILRPGIGLALALPLMFAVAAAFPPPATATPGTATAAAACSTLDGQQSFVFFGASLKQSPDMRAAAARKVDAQLDRGDCRKDADAGLARLRATLPADPWTAYLIARTEVLDGKRDTAERDLRALLTSHPQMTSTKVLLATVLLDKEQRAAAQGLLTQASAAEPQDFRVAFQLLRVQALNAPKGDGVGKLFTVLRDRRLPPDARETAQATLLYITALDLGQKEAALRESLSFQSQTPSAVKSNNLARLLAEESKKTDEARLVLQTVLGDPGAPAEAHTQARLLMAETWLLDAAAIDPVPSPANAGLVAKATAQLDGKMIPLANRIREFHDLSALRPFVADVHDPDERGPDGQTALCRATQLLDVERVRAALAAGAAVDGNCVGSTPLGYVVRAGEGLFPPKKEILKALLDAGAAVDPPLYAGSSYTAMSFCEHGSPGCAAELLPILKEYASGSSAKASEPPP